LTTPTGSWRCSASSAGPAPSATTPDPTVVLPESVGALDALRQLQLERRQLAIVISEHGADVVRRDDGTLDLVGRFPVHDLTDIGVDASETEATTIGGLLTERLGRLPSVGDEVVLPSAVAEVLAIADRTVSRVRVRPLEEEAGDHETGDDEVGSLTNGPAA
jgi:putative hemolysin